MSLNIKNERVHALVREVARRTGLSQTSAVEEALIRMLQELDAAAAPAGTDLRRPEIDILVADIHAMLTPARRGLLTTDDLYDEHGLPR